MTTINRLTFQRFGDVINNQIFDSVLARYTRNLVDEGNGKYNLMILCWGEGHGSSIHDHANADCFVKVLRGELMETRFAWPGDSENEQPMTKIGETTYGKDGVTYMCGEHITTQEM